MTLPVPPDERGYVEIPTIEFGITAEKPLGNWRTFEAFPIGTNPKMKAYAKLNDPLYYDVSPACISLSLN